MIVDEERAVRGTFLGDSNRLKTPYTSCGIAELGGVWDRHQRRADGA